MVAIITRGGKLSEAKERDTDKRITSINIDLDLWLEVKAEALKTQDSFTHVVEEALREWLRRRTGAVGGSPSSRAREKRKPTR
jgi:hypothetical protein